MRVPFCACVHFGARVPFLARVFEINSLRSIGLIIYLYDVRPRDRFSRILTLKGVKFLESMKIYIGGVKVHARGAKCHARGAKFLEGVNFLELNLTFDLQI